jgi:hypothetical protein
MSSASKSRIVNFEQLGLIERTALPTEITAVDRKEHEVVRPSIRKCEYPTSALSRKANLACSETSENSGCSNV